MSVLVAFRHPCSSFSTSHFLIKTRTGGWESRSRGNESMVMTDGMPRRGQETELLGWYNDAKAQLTRLRETPLNHRATTKSTGRMAVRNRTEILLLSALLSVLNSSLWFLILL